MSAAAAPVRPLTLLIAALGGEGGGVLTNWIVGAARKSGLPVQSTSIPGVAQRTGATTYYIEIWPEPLEADGLRRPVLALSPAPGEVDVVASTELLEAGRAMAGGFVTPERTCLIASSHRVLTTHEKSAMGDGQFDPERLRKAADALAHECLLLDMAGVATRAEAPLNAVMLGVLAGSGRLPIPPETFAAGIRAEGKAVEANLRGFEAGLAAVGADAAEEAADGTGGAAETDDVDLAAAAAAFPAEVREVVALALARLTDYQDAAYARLYLERLAPLRDVDPALLAEVARHLALRMSYEDIIRVASLKTAASRFTRIRADLGASADEPVLVEDYFKPRLAEVCDLLPERLAARVRDRAARSSLLAGWTLPLRIRTTTVSGFLMVWLLARLRPLRRRTSRFRAEAAAVDGWLADIGAAAERDVALAREICACAGLIKGYGDTHRRGSENYARIRDALIAPALAGGDRDGRAAEAVARARAAALADPAGTALDAELSRAAEPAPDDAGLRPRAGSM